MSEISPFEQARRLLKQINSPVKAVKLAKEVLVLLDQIEADSNRPVAFARSAKRGAAPLVYRVETTGLGENVAEYRPNTKAKPFRCPRPLYELMVTIFSESAKPLSLMEIVELIGKKTGLKPGEHQYRVPIRLWMHVEPPLLTRSRSRYGPANPKAYASAASKLWTNLKAN